MRFLVVGTIGQGERPPRGQPPPPPGAVFCGGWPKMGGGGGKRPFLMIHIHCHVTLTSTLNHCKLANKTCTTKYYTVVPLKLSFMPVLDLYVILISVWVLFYVILISVWVFCYTTWHVHFLTLDASEPFFVNMLSIAHPNPHSVMARLSAYLPTDN